MEKIKVAIIGPGNIGIDLMEKIRKRAKHLELVLMIGVDDNSTGIQLAKKYGVDTFCGAIDLPLAKEKLMGVKIVFDATSAAAHTKHAPILAAYGVTTIDLTPAAVGPYVVPVVNLKEHLETKNINLITCGGQATTPIVYAISRVQEVEYAEIISTISSLSAGAGTRSNIDEFTHTTSKALEVVGGAKKGKAIMILNPAAPPIMMRNTIYCKTTQTPDMAKIEQSIAEIVSDIQKYVPGYRLIMLPTFDGEKIVTSLEVEGEGDYLPIYAGNLDIITCAALELGEKFAEVMA